MPVISGLRRLRQEDQEFKDSLGYIVKPCLKKKNQMSLSGFAVWKQW
jgi:hypothetical protein